MYKKIHPDYGFSTDDPAKPKEAVIEQAMMSYFSSPCLERVSNSILGRLTRLNVALSVRAVVKDPKNLPMPDLIIPLAALFVSLLLQSDNPYLRTKLSLFLSA